MENSGSSNDRNSGKTEYQLTLIDALKKEIEIARRLDPEKLAAEIKKTGFSCQNCGKCCKRAFGGDNRVVLTPQEIEKIQKYTDLSKLEVAGPPLIPDISCPEEAGEGEEDRVAENSSIMPEIDEKKTSEPFRTPELLKEDIDPDGNIHAYGWMLRRKRNGDCVFLEKDTNRCRIYLCVQCSAAPILFILRDLNFIPASVKGSESIFLRKRAENSQAPCFPDMSRNSKIHLPCMKNTRISKGQKKATKLQKITWKKGPAYISSMTAEELQKLLIKPQIF